MFNNSRELKESMEMYYINPDFVATERVFPQQGRADFLKLDMNENVDGLPQELVDELKEKVTPEFLYTYPEPECFERAYESFIGVDSGMVMATNGSDMAIRYAFETFGERGKNIVTVSPTFEMYRINAKLLGMNHKAVGYNDDLTVNIDEILDNIDCDTRIVVLLNPNNPIGNIYEEAEVRKIIEKAEENNAVVIIDEAYYYFCDQTFVKLVQDYSNVMVFRTFSKLFAMAACRLGVIISNSKMIDWLKRGKLTFDVNSVALILGKMIIERPELINTMIQRAKEGKEYLLTQLNQKGYKTRWCEGNFIFFYPKNKPYIVEKRLKEEKILIKTFSAPLLQDVIRVTVASKEKMEKFIDVLTKVDDI